MSSIYALREHQLNGEYGGGVTENGAGLLREHTLIGEYGEG